MKSTLTFCSIGVLTFTFLLLFSLPCHAAMSSIANPTLQQAEQGEATSFHGEGKVNKLGFFKRIRMVKDVRLAMKKRPIEGEKASKLARIALYLFIGGIGLSYILSAFTTSAILSTLVSLALLASIVIALIVLFSDENRRSKAIAKAILIISAIGILLSVLFLYLLLVLFSGF